MFGVVPALTRLTRSAADREAAQALRLLGNDLDLGDLRSARTVATPAHQGLNSRRFALEHRLDAPVCAVAHPAGDSAGASRPGERDAEAYALDEAVHDDPTTDHGYRIAAPGLDDLPAGSHVTPQARVVERRQADWPRPEQTSCAVRAAQAPWRDG